VLVQKMPPPVPILTGATTFTLAGHTDAEAVAIYGSFNDWIQLKTIVQEKAMDGSVESIWHSASTTTGFWLMAQD
jgi:hypothetical protein